MFYFKVVSPFINDICPFFIGRRRRHRHRRPLAILNKYRHRRNNGAYRLRSRALDARGLDILFCRHKLKCKKVCCWKHLIVYSISYIKVANHYVFRHLSYQFVCVLLFKVAVLLLRVLFNCYR